MYSTSNIAKRFGISQATVKNYAAEFAAHLSATATPEPGHRRVFTDDDITVYALIVAQKSEGATHEQIHIMLQSGQRGDLPAAPRQLALIERVAMLERELSEARTQRDKALGQIEALESMIDRLLRMIQG